MTSTTRNSAEGRPRVAIIGSGFSGLAAAMALKKRGVEDFVVFEKNPGLGGTWWSNRYPGAEVDLESHIYSFSSERHDWTRTHAVWHEILDYLGKVARRWDLVKHIRFDERVESIVWSDSEECYTVTTSKGIHPGRFSAVISAVGFLNVPLIPPFARENSDYEGVICHTSSWPEGARLAGQRVAVLGTGSSAVQVVTEAEKVACEVTIFQIEPNWLLPKHSREFTPLERRLNRHRLVHEWRRRKLYLGYDLRQIHAGHARPDGRMHRKRHRAAVDFMQKSLGDRPELLELVTPQFPFEGRRTVVSDTYYPALKSPRVRIVPHAAKGLTRTGLIDADGDEHEADIIVLATGFDAANYLSSFRVTGSRGADLHERWAGEPQALLGLMVPDFPNFFMMYGPNTNSSPLVSFYQAQAAFAAGLIAQLRPGGPTRIEVRPWVFRAFNDWLQKRLSQTVWAETSSYFKAGTGRIVSQWPFSATAYILATKLARRFAVDVR